jgi:hypothetical protein
MSELGPKIGLSLVVFYFLGMAVTYMFGPRPDCTSEIVIEEVKQVVSLDLATSVYGDPSYAQGEYDRIILRKFTGRERLDFYQKDITNFVRNRPLESPCSTGLFFIGQEEPFANLFFNTAYTLNIPFLENHLQDYLLWVWPLQWFKINPHATKIFFQREYDGTFKNAKLR